MTLNRQTIAAFLGGVLIAASISAIGRGTAAQTGKWKIANIDVGAIQRKYYDADIATSAEKTTQESTKETEALLSQGYEPFAATVYNNGVYSNERVWFFRKRE